MKIVLIEDEEDIAALLKLQANIFGHQILLETDGLKGLKTIENEKPDLVILDVMLPSLGGLDVCRTIKSQSELQHIPVIIISARGESQDIQRAFDSGADDYVIKPFSPKELFSRIGTLSVRASK